MTTETARHSSTRVLHQGAGLALFAALACAPGCGDRVIGLSSGDTEGATVSAFDDGDDGDGYGGEGGDDGYGDADGGWQGPVLDLPVGEAPTSPYIEHAYPAPGDTGVRADVQIVVTFTEPMDAASTEAAFEGTGLGSVSFGWNAAGDTVTITPDSPLAYAEGERPQDVTPLVYGVRFGPGARDAEGDPIAQPSSFEFLTMRALTTDLIGPASLNGTVRSDSGDLGKFCVAGDGQVQFEGHDVWYRCGISMMLTRIAAGAEIVDARLSFEFERVFGDGVAPGDPFASLGPLRLVHAEFEEKTVASFLVPGELIDAWTEADPPNGPTVADVTPWLVDDFEAVGPDGYAQFRLEFEAFDDGDGAYDQVVIAPWQLQVTYLLP